MDEDFSDSNPALARLYPEHLKVVRERYDRMLDKAGAGHAVIFSGTPRTAFLDDMQYPFVANPHFLAWVPLVAVPMSYVVYTPGETPRLVYFQPHDYWHVVPEAPSGYWADEFDIRIVHDVAAIAPHLPERDNSILIGEITADLQSFGIERLNPTTAINLLHFARAAKTSYELACMRLASRRGARGHLAAEAAFRGGASEFGIHQAYCKAVSHTDEELPYKNIIALNEHGAVLHYTALDRESPRDRRSFLIDAGASVHGYASDITRTYSHEDARFAELIERVDALQLEIVGKVRAGVDYRDLHLETHALLGALLADAGLASGSPETLLATGVTSAFFPHGLGHLIGLQVHDVGGHMENETGTITDPPSGHRFLRLTRELAADMVVTIEPGLYVIDLLLEELRGSQAEQHVNWAGVDWLRPFGGIRIEDDIRVTGGAAENLTRDAFAALA